MTVGLSKTVVQSIITGNHVTLSLEVPESEDDNFRMDPDAA